LLFQNGYTLFKSIFLSQFGVDLDLIFSIIIPIGTITVILGVYIKNMLSSKVTAVKKNIKKIDATIKT